MLFRSPRLFLFVFLIIVVGGGAVYFVERGVREGGFESFFDALWWGVVTITTVGYGDKYPVTVLGRVFAALVMLTGMIIISLLSGTIASIYVDRKIQEGKGLQDLNERNHVLICGWNNSAEGILENLVNMQNNIKNTVVLINEMLPEAFAEVKSRFPSLQIKFVRGDFTNENILKRGSATQAGSAILIPDFSGNRTQENSDERTILAVLTLKSINPDIVTCAEVVNPENQQHLLRAGVDNTLVKGEFNGFLLAHSATEKGIPRLLREMLAGSGKKNLKQVGVPNAMVGKTFLELSEFFLKSGKGVILGILSEEKKISLDDILSEDSSSIDAFIKRKFQEAEIDLAEEQKSEENVQLSPPADYIIKETDKAFLVGSGS